MKKLITVIILIIFVKVCNAQTFAEWFKQKTTQKKYLIQQIAAFQMYLGYVQKGYSIAQTGLSTISNIKKGDFNLHRDFFSSLKSINPRIRNYAKVADIIAFQINIMKIYKDTYRQVQTSLLFDAGEADYILKVFTNLLSNCTEIIDDLINVTTDGELEMKDDERLRRIEALYRSMQDNYTFAQSFSGETKLLTGQRMKEKNNVQSSRTLNGIKNQ
jgi:predicted lactoylglutathione lyase